MWYLSLSNLVFLMFIPAPAVIRVSEKKSGGAAALRLCVLDTS